ncbi:homogentisate 1,2-dioxygenase [Pseudorhodoferax sp.]|uniref:homogentisate 1,2-dioxygenase n=1 Tax=Pseudorhodoferax sp. TaxID=1993553 RepID=UPI002DD62284|nr:homogentisate 1,2-dioxygenase [Pseudorhodoferax sp.]
MSTADTALRYQGGFGNEFETESLPGALPVGRNSPQQTPYGLYVEQLSGSPFVGPRASIRRSWLYKRLPTAGHGTFEPVGMPTFVSEVQGRAPGNRVRLGRQPDELKPAAFPFGVATLLVTGSCAGRSGGAVHSYAVSADADAPVFSDADGELLWMPTEGTLLFCTEFGRIEAAVGEIVLVPRGVKFTVQPVARKTVARGYLVENYGMPFQLPDLGPIGANGLAAARDFLYPVAHAEPAGGPVQWINKFDGGFWQTTLAQTPLDVVAWRGNHAPCKYDLSRFMVINTVSFDHADPSIFTVLTSPGGAQGAPNLELAIFPPRWQVADDTFRPPWFHRNMMSEAMGLLRGRYEVRAEGLVAGGLAVHNCMLGHGPDAASWKAASERELKPEYLDGTIGFVLESPQLFVPTPLALASAACERNYDVVWAGFSPASLGKGATT